MLRITKPDAEMLRALHELRYLTVAQVQRVWFAERTGDGARIRMSRLSSERLVQRVPLNATGGSAYRLTNDGVACLRTKRAGDFSLYEDLSQLYLQHLLATNDVFLALAGDVAQWDDLPFTWEGSHRARLPYVELMGGEHGAALRRRRRMLAPDAVVSPQRGQPGPRCFLELDRSTEAIAEAAGRNSIIGKLKAYRTLLRQPVPGTTLTAYDSRYRDRRPARVVFVVDSGDPAGRRLRSIAEAAKLVPDIDVRCVALADVGGLRDAFGLQRLGSAAPAPKPKITVELSSTSLNRLIESHLEAAPKLKRLTEPEERSRMRQVYDGAHEVFVRLKDELRRKQGATSNG